MKITEDVLEQIRQLLTLNKFREWLEALPPGEKIGVVGSECHHPIVYYLTRSLGKAMVTYVQDDWVYVVGVEEEDEDETHSIFMNHPTSPISIPKVPTWISWMINELKRLKPDSTGETLRAKKVLKIVHRITAIFNAAKTETPQKLPKVGDRIFVVSDELLTKWESSKGGIPLACEISAEVISIGESWIVTDNGGFLYHGWFFTFNEAKAAIKEIIQKQREEANKEFKLVAKNYFSRRKLLNQLDQSLELIRE